MNSNCKVANIKARGKDIGQQVMFRTIPCGELSSSRTIDVFLQPNVLFGAFPHTGPPENIARF